MSTALQDLVATSFRHGKAGKGVITPLEAMRRAFAVGTTITISSRDRKVFFFSDDHCFGYPVLPKDFVPCTSVFPMYVAERTGLPNGRIDTVDKLITVFHNDQRRIESIEELVELLDAQSTPALT